MQVISIGWAPMLAVRIIGPEEPGLPAGLPGHPGDLPGLDHLPRCRDPQSGPGLPLGPGAAPVVTGGALYLSCPLPRPGAHRHRNGRRP
jgi:hypothetical protein